jgi:hypothetical protein
MSNNIDDAPGVLKVLAVLYFGAGGIAVTIFVVTTVLPAIAAFLVAHAGAISVAAVVAILKALVAGRNPLAAGLAAGAEAGVVDLFVKMLQELRTQYLG